MYEVRPGAIVARQSGRCTLIELCTCSPEAYRALFAFVCRIDFTTKMVSDDRPVDEGDPPCLDRPARAPRHRATPTGSGKRTRIDLLSRPCRPALLPSRQHRHRGVRRALRVERSPGIALEVGADGVAAVAETDEASGARL